jgi:serine/threonine protein kinase
MIITNYYELGDLTHYITKDFFNISWEDKLKKLRDIATGIKVIHTSNIIHKDYHSGNIFISSISEAITGDLGISKPLNDEEDNEIYGIIPYIAPEIFQGQKYTKASDIYSFGMVMWELMTGRKPFWDQNHDTELIIEICDGLRPPIVTNAPEGYIELMQKCWHPDPNERPTANELFKIFAFKGNLYYWKEKTNPTKIIESPDIGPITTSNPGAIYKSRPLSRMIRSAESTRSLRSQNIHNILFIDKRKLNCDLFRKGEVYNKFFFLIYCIIL